MSDIILDTLSIRATPRMHTLLHAVLATGMYGASITETAERLLCEALTRRCGNVSVAIPRSVPPARIENDQLVGRVLLAVHELFNISAEDILSDRRDGPIVEARHFAILMLTRTQRLTCAQIGRAFKRDHSTILAAAKTARLNLDRNATLRGHFERLMEALNA